MVQFKVQVGFWPKWDGEGEPSGPVEWEDPDPGLLFDTNEAARADMLALCEARDIDPNACRIVPVSS